MQEILTYLIFSLINLQYGYAVFLYIIVLIAVGIVLRVLNKQNLTIALLLPIGIFILLQIAMQLQPPGSYESKDMVLRGYLYIFVNPLTLIIFGILATLYFVKSTSTIFKYPIIFVTLISCFIINAVIYDSVFFYIRDNVITKFYPYSRKQSPATFQEHLKKCLPNAVKYYNRQVKIYQRNLAENPNYFKEQWDADANIVSPEHLQKLYNDPIYFEPYLKLCYNDQPPEPNFVNPFLGMDKLPEDNSPIQYQNGIF